MTMNKIELRKQLIKKRDSIENRELKSHEIFNNLQSLNVWKSAKIIHTYVSFKSEVDTRFIIYHALLEGKKVLCPIVKDDLLLVGEIKSFNDLKTGKYGIMEPEVSIDINLEEIDLIIVPGIAFDLEGYRIGYGKGYYDRFLNDLKRPIKVGLTYDDLILENIPHDLHDIRVDYVISEKRIIKTNC